MSSIYLIYRYIAKIYIKDIFHYRFKHRRKYHNGIVSSKECFQMFAKCDMFRCVTKLIISRNVLSQLWLRWNLVICCCCKPLFTRYNTLPCANLYGGNVAQGDWAELKVNVAWMLMKMAFFHIRSAAGRSDNLLTPHLESCRDKLAEQALRAGKVAFAVCPPHPPPFDRIA